MTLRIWSKALGDFGTNCYIVACQKTGASVVIDPGYADSWIQRTLETEGLKPDRILLTHGHLDHIGGVRWVKSLTGAPVAIHKGDAPMLVDAKLNGSFRFGRPIVAVPADEELVDGQEIPVGDLTFQVLHTPGHTRGGVCFYQKPVDGDSGHLIAGDTLFAGSVGRTDLPGGSHDTLIRSIKEKLLSLPPDTVVYPGHGPTTTIGDEAAYNPFL